jgi:hypothetical protein
MPGRFIRSRDLNFFDTVNKELLGNPQTNKDGIINQEVIVYKVAVYETETNLYGESSSGKRYQDGVKLTCLIEAEDFDFETNEFGPSANQNATFAFLRQQLIDANYVPDMGDVVEWNYTFFEINSINENQLIGGQQDNNHSVICTAFLADPTTVGLARSRGY